MTYLNPSDSISTSFSDMFVDQSGNIYLVSGDYNIGVTDAGLVIKFAAGSYDTSTLVPSSYANGGRYGLSESMFRDCQGNIYIYTSKQRVL
jgi:hypothetical protein